MSTERSLPVLLSLKLCVLIQLTQPAVGDEADRIWRQRHQEFIDRIASETIEETARNLNAHEDLVVRARMHPYDPIPQLEFFACLADRRLARLYSHLETLPEEQADQFCRTLFDRQLQRQQADFTGILQVWKQGKSPESPSTFPIGENWHALHAIVFLSATYCPIDETLRQIDQWSELPETFVRDADFESLGVDASRQAALRAEFRQYAEPEPLFLFNLYAHMLQERQALTNDELAGLCPDRVMVHDRDRKATLIRWNSLPERPPGVSGERDAIATYAPFRSWYSTRSDQQQQAAVARLRARLVELDESDP